MTEVIEPTTAAIVDDTVLDDLPEVDAKSATFAYFGDWRGLFLGLWSGSMQNMHPKLAAGVWEHSLLRRKWRPGGRPG